MVKRRRIRQNVSQQYEKVPVRRPRRRRLQDHVRHCISASEENGSKKVYDKMLVSSMMKKFQNRMAFAWDHVRHCHLMRASSTRQPSLLVEPADPVCICLFQVFSTVYTNSPRLDRQRFKASASNLSPSPSSCLLRVCVTFFRIHFGAPWVQNRI